MSENVKTIPEGYHSINPYLVVRNAARAIEFYKKAFGAEERFRMHGPDGKTIMHADLKIGDSVFMLTEESTEMKTLSPESIGGSPVSMYVYVKDVDAVFNQDVSEHRPRSSGITVLQLPAAYPDLVNLSDGEHTTFNTKISGGSVGLLAA